MNTIRTTKAAGMFAITMLLGAPAFAEAPKDPHQAPDAMRTTQAQAEAPKGNAEERRTEEAATEADDAEARGMPAAPSQSALRAESLPMSALDKAQVEGVQEKLRDAGYYEGEVDGIVGPMTRNALRTYYRDQARLAATGRLHADSAVLFGLDETEIEKVKGTAAPERETLRGERATDANRGAERGQAEMEFDLSETTTESEGVEPQGDVRRQPADPGALPDEQMTEPTSTDDD